MGGINFGEHFKKLSGNIKLCTKILTHEHHVMLTGVHFVMLLRNIYTYDLVVFKHCGRLGKHENVHMIL